MPALSLSADERRARRAEAHHLEPVVHVGGEGLSEAVLRETEAALRAHGLIKVRVFADARPEREAMLAVLADRLDAAPVQHIGKLLVLWRPLPEKEKVERPDRQPGPRFVKVITPSRSATHRPQVKKLKVLGNERLTPGGKVKRRERRAVSPKKCAPD